MTSKRNSSPKSKTRTKASNKSTFLSAFICGALLVGIAWFMTNWINHSQIYQSTNGMLSSITRNISTPAIAAKTQASPVRQIPKVITPAPKPVHYYMLYLTSYVDFHKADNERAYLLLGGYDAKVTRSQQLNNYILWIGPFLSLEATEHVQVKLKSEYTQSRVTEYSM